MVTNNRLCQTYVGFRVKCVPILVKLASLQLHKNLSTRSRGADMMKVAVTFHNSMKVFHIQYTRPKARNNASEHTSSVTAVPALADVCKLQSP